MVGPSADNIMKAKIALPIALGFIILGLVGWSNPEVVQTWFEEVRENANSESESPLVGIQEQENWLVVVVDFSDEASGNGRDIIQAKGLLDGSNGAVGYIEAMSGGESSLNLTYYSEIIRASLPSSSYGYDTENTRDVGSIEGGPAALAAEVITKLASKMDWSAFDLDKDGNVDRLLILHTARPQEDGSGATSRIWSHFGPLQEAIDLKDGLAVHHYTMASLRSSNYRGTIIHEMLHQIGALDLYAVHDETVSKNWYGVGDWDIMASGNWNGNGAIPALPMAATMELLGLERSHGISSWNPQDGECKATIKSLMPMSNSGSALRIPLAENEWLWIEHRAEDDFDTRIPGSGLLVSAQNLATGDLENNVVNHDPDSPWLRIIEADGGDELMRAADKGSEEDTFQLGDTFGASGIQVRDSHGRLVQWTAVVFQMQDELWGLNLTKPTCEEEFEVLPPSGGLTTLPGESFFFAMKSTEECQPQVSINSNDGRSIAIIDSTTGVKGETWKQVELSFNRQVSAGKFGLLTGFIGCGNTTWDIATPWSTHFNRVLPSLTQADVSTSKSTDISIELEIEGDGSRTVELFVEGPLSRVATIQESAVIQEGSSITLTVEPNGLLTPGMLARGEVIIVDDLGKVERVDVEVTGEAIAGTADVIRTFRDPASLTLIVCLLVALWVVLGIEKKQKIIPLQPVAVSSVDDFLNPTNALFSAPQEDPFNRQE